MTRPPVSSVTQAAQRAGSGLQGQAGNVSRSCPAVTLNIGVFFDGTGNNAANTETAGRSSSYTSAKSNVALLIPLYKSGSGHDQENSCGGIAVKYESIYVEGIGTTANWSDWWPSNRVGAATGMGMTGVEARVYGACLEVGEVITRLSPGVEPKEVILDVFGFSRGAAAARYFVNCFRQGYIEYLAYYVDRRRASLPPGRKVRIRFVGIFDTVAAIGDGEDDDNGAVNVHLAAAQADRIYHLTAMHEYRTNFRLNHNLPGGGEARQMLGAHSDVGGGYRGTGDRTRVGPARSRSFASAAEAEAARRADVATAAAARSDAASFWVQDGWIRPNEPVGGLINAPSPVRPVTIPNRAGGSRTYYSYSTGAVLDRPWVQAGLSRIPLRVMYDQARAAGVPFLDFFTGPEYALPAGLAQLAGSAATGGPLPEGANRREILRNYGHVSANHDGIGMGPQLGTGRQRMWHRTIYPNQPGQAK